MLWNYKQSKDLETEEIETYSSKHLTKQWCDQASTNLWQTRTHNSTTVNHWTLLPDKKTWKNRTDEATHSPHPSPLLTMPGEISSPLPCHGTFPCAKPAAPPSPLEVKEGADPCPLNLPNICEDLHRLGTPSGWNQRQLFQGL